MLGDYKFGNTSFNLDVIAGTGELPKMTKTEFKKTFEGKVPVNVEAAWDRLQDVIKERKEAAKKDKA